MSKVIDFFKTPQTETIDQAFFEKFADAALLLKCFECVKDATEFVEDGGEIQLRDDVYVGLIEAFWALKVLFERKTGGDATRVSNDHWAIARQHLLAGQEPPDMHIPIDEPQISALHPTHFNGQTDLALACMALNSSENVRLAINSALVAANAQSTANAAIEAINVDTALRQLVLRLSGGSMESMAGVVARISRPDGETLQ